MVEEHLSRLSADLRGSLITPASREYEVARKVYNGMIDRRPEAIVRCVDVADVTAAVKPAGLTCSTESSLSGSWSRKLVMHNERDALEALVSEQEQRNSA